MTLIEVKNVAYRKGTKMIFTDLNFSLEKGRIVALLGENGAGKTSIMRLIAGLAKNWNGSILIDGYPVGAQTKASVALLTDLNDFSETTSLKELLLFYQRFYADFDSARADELLRFMGLTPEDKLKLLSKGNREKAALVLTLARKAKVYLLDEPLGGVDLLAREKIIQSLVKWYEEDSLILITTHQIAEIESIVDEVLILKDQKIQLHKELEQLREQEGLGLEGIYRKVMAQ